MKNDRAGTNHLLALETAASSLAGTEKVAGAQKIDSVKLKNSGHVSMPESQSQAPSDLSI